MLAVCNYKNMPGQTQKLFAIFETLDIDPYKKSVLQDRYLTVLRNFQYRANLYSCMFFSSRIIVTVGSILVPAFLSIQGNPIRDNLYFAAWLISILVTVCNGFVTLFKIDKKYFFLHMTLELLHSEGWQYIALTGRYGPKDAPVPPTHDNQFVIFCRVAEKIKLKQVEEEYWKFSDTSATGNSSRDGQRPMDYIQTPITQQGALASLPAEQKAAIEGWLSAMTSKKAITGLMPRPQSMMAQFESARPTPIRKNHETHVDGESPPKVRRTSSTASVSVLPYVSEEPSPGATVVPHPRAKIPENTTITLPNSTDERV